jgi:heat shock protein HslJ
MLKKTSLLLLTLYVQTLMANELDGVWHLRVMDGMEVRKARAILDFDMEKMKLSGFDACNRIGGEIKKVSDTNTSIPIVFSTRMACRGKIHTWVSKRLHKTLKEGFTVKEEKRYGVEGITLKSSSHELFLKQMERD